MYHVLNECSTTKSIDQSGGGGSGVGVGVVMTPVFCSYSSSLLYCWTVGQHRFRGKSTETAIINIFTAATPQTMCLHEGFACRDECVESYCYVKYQSAQNDKEK